MNIGALSRGSLYTVFTNAFNGQADPNPPESHNIYMQPYNYVAELLFL